MTVRISCPDVFVGKGVLKLCSRFIGHHPCRSVISNVAKQLVFSCTFAEYFQNTFC